MPVFKCVGCSKNKQVECTTFHPLDVFRIVVHCDCKERTFVEMTENVITSLPGRILGMLNENVFEEAKDRFNEARECYYATTLRASAVMARSAIESALKDKEFNRGTLEDKIEAAHENNGPLKTREYNLAHGNRLVGNDAIHKSVEIRPEEVVAALGATAMILNSLYPSD